MAFVRAILQHTFFPPSFTDASPTPPLRPGDARLWTHMKILVELRDGVTLQIPFREPSKVNALCLISIRHLNHNRTGNGMEKSMSQIDHESENLLLSTSEQATVRPSAIPCP